MSSPARGELDRPEPIQTLAILLVEDEPEISEPIAEALRREGHHLTVVSHGDRALKRLDEEVYDLLVCDIRLPGADGLSIFRKVREQQPDAKVILMSAYGSVAEAVAAVKDRAVDYLAKPFAMSELLSAVHQVGEERRLARSLAHARERVDSYEGAAIIIGETPAMVSLVARIRAVADSDAPVLITGETGTGKELVARALHAQSSRHGKPFVDVNCAAFQDTLLEAELFGHERGAFTGAERRRDGRFRTADGGTLFLDEVGEMSPSAQAKMLRSLQDGSFQPLGSSTTISVDVRTIAATNVDLRSRIAEGRFREDLFYRLKVFHLHVPALRERRADLPLLAEYFCRQLAAGAEGAPAASDRRRAPVITPRAWAALSHYRFPGNVRELKHALRHALVLSSGGDIDLDHLPEEVRGRSSPEARGSGSVPVVGPASLQPLEAAQRQFEREYLLRALREADWNRTRVAQLLGISRKTLWQKLRRLGIDAGSD
ncbi:MAG TPA: sigma-54 dependent transcriptional regulator [Kofleriaceae bacterium]|nr:sigma-54 dependent transcriptional regulator [Kofleriaceae bacterium]